MKLIFLPYFSKVKKATLANMSQQQLLLQYVGRQNTIFEEIISPLQTETVRLFFNIKKVNIKCSINTSLFGIKI